MYSYGMDYRILGDEMQILEVDLRTGETVIAEAGAMNYMDPGIDFEARMGDGTEPPGGMWEQIAGAGKRLLTGESLFMTHFTNASDRERTIAFASPYPGKIIPINLSETGGELLCQKDAFLCAQKGTRLDIALTKRIGVGLLGGEGFILQRLIGEGLAFIHAGGMIVKKELHGERLLVDTGCLAAFTPGISYNISRAGNLKSMIFGGEGLFLADLQGTGAVYLQSLPFSRLAGRVLKYAPQMGGRSRGEGSILGGLGDLFMGDN
ncbi:MAG: TIGR00266 family protein [Spirochaetales bacterium]|nr:TIGR00266 family protein [Spirochaetales bacterium]